MKVIAVHNFYQQPGGEDQVYRTESELLTQHGHEVIRYEADNSEVKQLNPFALGLKTIWNQDRYRKFKNLVARERPDVVHLHNTFPLLSPAIYYASRRAGAAVVQTLHNFRLVCPGATLFREGAVCEECLDSRLKLASIQHACYRNNHLASATTALMLATHRAAGTWRHQVDAYLAVSRALREKMIAGGLPAEKIHVKANCVHPDPGVGQRRGNYALFIGRLEPEKGLATLIEAWRHLRAGGVDLPLKIAGNGSLSAEVAAAARDIPGVEWLGRLERPAVWNLLQDARCVVVPSIWYEAGIPLTALEAMAAGIPVIASRLGSLGSDLIHGESALLFAPKNGPDLAAQVRSLVANPPLEQRLARQARVTFEAGFTGERIYQQLIQVYQSCRASVPGLRTAETPLERLT